MAASFDETLRYGAQTPFSDQLAFHLEGGAWQVDANHDSIIAAGNGGSKPVKARLTFFYAGGTKKYQIERTIAPDDQMWIDVGNLIRNGVPDKDGTLLPSDLTTGAYQLIDLAETPSASLYEGKVVTDKTYGHATYGCMICCGYRGISFIPDPVFTVIDSESALDAYGQDSCGNFNRMLSGYASSWWSGDTSIMSVKPRQASGISLGSTTTNAELTGIISGPPRDGQTCPTSGVPVQGGGTVPGAPAGMLFFSDLTTKSNICAISSQNAVERIIQYQVVDQHGTPVGKVSMQEDFRNLSNATCSNPPPSPTQCNSNGVSSEGIFTDMLSTNACSPPNLGTCGFSINPDLWQYCKSGSPAQTLGTPTYGVLWQGVYVDGSTATIKPGTPVPNN